MRLIDYINSKREHVINSLHDLSDEEYRQYSNELMNIRAASVKAKKVSVSKPVKIKFTRADKGKKRAEYSSDLPKQYISYMKRANRKSMEFDITPEDLEIVKSLQCVYCGGSANGLDRVDPSVGYTKENCVPCCVMCNMMKFTYNVERFKNQISRIYKHLC